MTENKNAISPRGYMIQSNDKTKDERYVGNSRVLIEFQEVYMIQSSSLRQ